jgi:DNA-binding CsgD family transcriptional regulator
MEKQRRDEEIVKLRSQGKTYKEIGDKFGLTKQAVFLIVKEREKETAE